MPVRPRGIAAPVLIAALLLSAFGADAKQLGFARQLDKGAIEYSYRFYDADGREQALRFRLPEMAVVRGHREYRPIDSPEVATTLKRRVAQSIEAYVRPLGGTIEVTVERSKGSLSVHYEVKLPPNRATPAVEAEVERRAESATSETYADFFNVRDASGVEVRPDFARIVPHDHLDVCIIGQDGRFHTAYESGIDTGWGRMGDAPVSESPLRALLEGEVDHVITDDACGDPRFDLSERDFIGDQDGGLQTRTTGALQIERWGVRVQSAIEYRLAR